MGMSASQARYLQLTARRSDLEFLAQQICQQRLTLAAQTESAMKEYEEKMNDRNLYFRAPYTHANALDENGNAKPLIDTNTNSATMKRLDYYDITNQMNDPNQPGLGMRVVNSAGKIVVTAIPEGGNPDDYVVDPTLFAKQSDGEAVYRNACNYLQAKLISGEWSIQQPDLEEPSVWKDVSLSGSTYINYLLYTENDSAATTEYEHKMSVYQHDDKMLEMQLQQVQTQQSAVAKELESVSSVIKDNVEKTFKTFSA